MHYHISSPCSRGVTRARGTQIKKPKWRHLPFSFLDIIFRGICVRNEKEVTSKEEKGEEYYAELIIDKQKMFQCEKVGPIFFILTMIWHPMICPTPTFLVEFCHSLSLNFTFICNLCLNMPIVQTDEILSVLGISV